MLFLVGEQHGRKSGNRSVGGEHRGIRRASRGEFLTFFPIGLPGRSIWTKLPHITLVILVWWVSVLAAADQAGCAESYCSRAVAG